MNSLINRQLQSKRKISSTKTRGNEICLARFITTLVARQEFSNLEALLARTMKALIQVVSRVQEQLDKGHWRNSASVSITSALPCGSQDSSDALPTVQTSRKPIMSLSNSSYSAFFTTALFYFGRRCSTMSAFGSSLPFKSTVEMISTNFGLRMSDSNSTWKPCMSILQLNNLRLTFMNSSAIEPKECATRFTIVELGGLTLSMNGKLKGTMSHHMTRRDCTGHAL
jgi:hypothetical protein